MGEHYWQRGSGEPQLPVWEQTPRAVPPPLGEAPVTGDGGSTPSVPSRVRRVPQGRQPTGVLPVTPVAPAALAAPAASPAPVRVPVIPGAPVAGVAAVPTQPPARGRWPALVAAGAAAALLAGLLVWHESGSPHASSPQARHSPTGGRTATPQVDGRAPFAAALVDLALQPAVRYRWSADGSDQSELSVTAAGEALGSALVNGTSATTLRVGGTTYSLGGVDGQPDLAGTWVAGAAPAETAGGDTAPRVGQTPVTLANLLLQALDSDQTTLPSPDAASATVDGVPALTAVTPAGDLLISQARPYRLLEFAPSGPSPDTPQDAPPPPVGSATDQAVFRGPAALRASALAPSAGAFTVSGLSAPDSAALRGKIRSDTGQLANAVDLGLQVRVDGKPDVRCSSGGCQVTSHLTGVVPSDDEARQRLTGTQVTVLMTAAMTVDGAPAGACSTTEQLPLDGTRDISCFGAAARPTGRAVKPDAAVTFRALAQVDTTALRRTESDEDVEAVAAAALAGTVAPEALGCLDSPPSGATSNGPGWILNTTGASGRTETGQACLKNPPDNTNDDHQPDPPGYADAKTELRRLGLNPETDLTRCHLIPPRFGGSNTLTSNLSPCTQATTGLQTFESEVAAALSRTPAGTIHYLNAPLFATRTSTIPTAFTLLALCYTPTGLPSSVLSHSVLNQVPATDSSTGPVDIGN
ncbi:hypothetical protein QBC98_000086 [Kitasatospora acidiphila]